MTAANCIVFCLYIIAESPNADHAFVTVIIPINNRPRRPHSAARRPVLCVMGTHKPITRNNSNT